MHLVSKTRDLAIRLLLMMVLLFSVFSNSFLAFADNSGTPRFTFTLVNGKPSVEITDLEPGDVYNDTFKVRLLSGTKAAFKVDFMDSSAYHLDYLGLEESEVDTVSLKSGLNFPNGDIFVLSAYEEVEIPFEMHVHESLAPGDYHGMFLVTVLDYGEDLDVDKYQGENIDSLALGMGTKITLGLGVDFILRINGDVIADLEFTDMSYVLADDESIIVTINYLNNGTVSLRPNAHLVISNFLGRRYFNNDYVLSVVSPGENAQATLKIPTDDFYLNYGIYNLDLDLKYNVLDFSKVDTTEYFVGTGRLTLYSLPWFVVLIVVLILAIIILLFVLKNYKYLRLYKSSKAYTVKQGDTLQSISQKYIQNPKDLIFINKLKEPYFLEAGKDILIPNQVKNEKTKNK